MLFNRRALAAAALAVAPVALAQTYTDCNPLEKTCPNNTGFEGTTFSSDFTTGSGANASWSTAAYTTINYGSKGAEFTIAKSGQAPTIQTDFYIFFGKVEVVMQAAPGTGIVSSIVLESDDLDEIDWEFLGGDTTQVETNYFGKGNTTTYDRAIYYPVSSPQATFHTYTVDWTSEYLSFAVDGTVLRTLNYADANGGANFPQTPMRLKLGNWAGGAAGNAAGTIEWAGGETDFTQAPFTMYVKSVKVTNYNPGAEYEWTDKTGSYKSIKVVNGTSASAGASSGTALASAATKTKAPIQFHSVKQVEQTAAAVSSTSKGAAPSSISSSSFNSSASSASSFHRNGTLQLTTLSSAATAVTSGSSGSGASVSGTRSGSSASASKTAAAGNSTRSSSALTAQQTTNGAASNGMATAMVALSGMAFAFMML